MSETHPFNTVAIVLGGLSLVGIVANGLLVLSNQKSEAEVQGRQQFPTQTAQINQVSNALVQTLGAAAVNGKDSEIQALLTEFGITVTANPSVPAQAAPAAKTP